MSEFLTCSLSLLKYEDALSGIEDSEVDKTELASRVSSLSTLLASQREQSIQSIEVFKILPVLVASSLRILCRFINPKDGSSNALKCVVSCMDLQKQLLSLLVDKGTSSSSPFSESFETKAMIRDTIEEVRKRLGKLFLVLIMLLGWLVGKGDGMGADAEQATILTIDTYALCVQTELLGGADGLAALDRLFNDHVIAQMVSTCLQLTKHKSKTIGKGAIELLGRLMQISMGLGDPSNGLNACARGQATWRTYFPGVFSGLFAICTGDYKKGSKIREGALYCLLRATAFITCDAAYDNKKLLTQITSSSNGSGSGSGSDPMPILSAFEEMLAKAESLKETTSAKSASSSSSSSSPRLAPSKALPSDKTGLPRTEASDQWRVDVLQRLEVLVPKAWRAVISTASSTAHVTSLGALEDILVGSLGFLGAGATAGIEISPAARNMLTLLLNSCSNSDASVSNAALKCWGKLCTDRDTLKSISAQKLRPFLMDTLLQQTAKAAKIGASEETLNATTGTALGAALALLSSLPQTSSNTSVNHHHSMITTALSSGTVGNKNMFDCIISLLIPDIDLLSKTPNSGWFSGATGGSLALSRSLFLHSHTFTQLTSLKKDSKDKVGEVTPIGTKAKSITVGYYNCATRVGVIGSGTAAGSGAASATTLSLQRLCVFFSKIEALPILVRKVSRIAGKDTYGAGTYTDHGDYGDSIIGDGSGGPHGAMRALQTEVAVWSAIALALVGCVEVEGLPDPYVVLSGKSSTNSSGSDSSGSSRIESTHTRHTHTHTDTSSRPSFFSSHSGPAAADATWAVCQSITKEAVASIRNFLEYSAQQASREALRSIERASIGHSSAGWTSDVHLLDGDSSPTAGGNVRYSSLTDTKGHVADGSEGSTIVVKNLLRSLVVSKATESIGTVAAVSGRRFRSLLAESIFPLLLLAANNDVVAKQAAESTLSRIALYCEYDDVASMLRCNLDYATDEISSALLATTVPKGLQKMADDFVSRGISSGSHTLLVEGGQLTLPGENANGNRGLLLNHSDSIAQFTTMSMGRTRVALVIDVLFRSLSIHPSTGISTSDGSSGERVSPNTVVAAPVALMRDLVLDVLEAVDALSSSAVFPLGQAMALLHALVAILTHAAQPTHLLISSPQAQRFYNASSGTSRGIFPTLTAPTTTASTTTTAYSTEGENAGEMKGGDKQDDVQEDDGEDEGEGEDKEEKESKPTEPQKLMLDILDRCHYLITIPVPGTQVIVVDMIGAALLRLCVNRRQLLPAVHKIWPCVAVQLGQQIDLAIAALPPLQMQMQVGAQSGSSFIGSGNKVNSPKTKQKVRTRDSSLLDVGTTKSEGHSSQIGSINMKIGLEKADVSSQIKSMKPLDSKIDTIARASRASRQAEQLLKPPPFLLQHLLDLMALFPCMCGDFMVFKFREELWPVLLPLIQVEYSTALNRLVMRKNDLNSSVNNQVLVSLVQMTSSYAEQSDCWTYFKDAAPAVSMLFLPLLANGNNPTVIAAALQLYKALLGVAADEGTRKLVSELLWAPMCYNRPDLNRDGELRTIAGVGERTSTDVWNDSTSHSAVLKACLCDEGPLLRADEVLTLLADSVAFQDNALELLNASKN